MTNQNLPNEIIIAYRNLIEERYQFAKIKAAYSIPSSFDSARAATFKNYFLQHLYPPPEKRTELDAAFQNLDTYIKNPEKLLRLLLDSGSLLFKYGRHLPKILAAGLKALKSFRAVNQLENKLVESANQLKMQPPFSVADVKNLLKTLSQEDLQEFMENNRALFETFHDRKLVRRILEIVEHLIKKMNKRPNVYSEMEVNALSIGRDIIQQGELLFDQLNKEEQQQIFDLTMQIEEDFINGLFK